jgi:hypothetical protein
MKKRKFKPSRLIDAADDVTPSYHIGRFLNILMLFLFLFIVLSAWGTKIVVWSTKIHPIWNSYITFVISVIAVYLIVRTRKR